MFGVYFGKYLMDEGVIPEEYYYGLIEATKNSKVKMGILAVEAGLMTEEQAAEVNLLQQQQDKKFGDIAIEKGYLSDDDVADLLDEQGDSYLLYLQAIIESGLMDMDSFKEHLLEYRRAKKLTPNDLEAIKSGDVDRIVPVFMKDNSIPLQVKEYVYLTSRNIVRFIDRFFRMDRVEKLTEYEAEYIAAQSLHGDSSYLTAFAGSKEGLKAIADGFVDSMSGGAKDLSYDALDVACEFLNVNNGLYITGLSNNNVDEVTDSPIMKSEKSKITSIGDIYKVPLYIEGSVVDLIICFNDGWSFD
ncbi:MAG: hypothetical protein IJ054_05895 [Lachnospiraceae bacterium]|nr:hypothetical protein [Lachnospiraceae bacterium]MBQ9233137.1 hypothetical protein [Lachnospiraceae bacterium]